MNAPDPIDAEYEVVEPSRPLRSDEQLAVDYASWHPPARVAFWIIIALTLAAAAFAAHETRIFMDWLWRR